MAHRTLTFAEALKSLKEQFTRTHPLYTVDWVVAHAGRPQFFVGEFASHFTNKPNVKFRKEFYSLENFDAWSEIVDLDDGYETWHSNRWALQHSV